MSDTDSDSRLSGELGAEHEGACGKLLEEIAEQDRVVELDPIDVMVDRILSFIDLDKAVVTDEERARVYARMEEIGSMQEETIIVFARAENTVEEITVDKVSDEPKVVLIKPPVGGSIKVIHNPVFLIICNLLSQLIPLSDESYYVFLLAQSFVPLVLRSHPLHQARQFTVVTEFSQWVAAQDTPDFTLTNPMQDGVMDSAVNILQEDSSQKIVRGETTI